MLTKNCVLCKAEYVKSRTRSVRAWEDARYCSRSCTNKAKLGKPTWCKGTKGLMIAWNKGLKCPQFTGENNGTWTGTDDKYWRNHVLIRDDYTCQKCGLKDIDIMQVDHIKPKMQFPDLRYDPNNMQTLCPNCHARKTVEMLRMPRSVPMSA